jgi:hypothetical protein
MNRWKRVVFAAVLVMSASQTTTVGQAAPVRTPVRTRAAAQAPATRPAPQATVGRAGMVATIEPEGAGPTPEPDLLKRLTPAQRVGLIRNTAGLTAVRLPNGAMMLDLAGRYREFAVVRLDPAGRSWMGCVHGERELMRSLDPCAPASTPRFEER